MPRWEPDVQQRLVQAALDLFTGQGYDATTVGDIAGRAGVTKRTYNRHFPDKREVLFGGADLLRERLNSSLRSAPRDLSSMDASIHAVRACGDLFHHERHEQLRQREDLINSSRELQEREARKIAVLAEAVAAALVERGTDQNDARLIADLATTVFTHAARLWMRDPATSFAVLVERAALQAQEVLVCGARPPKAVAGRSRQQPRHLPRVGP